jgi:predicted SAM-dependent methyltransferase
MRLNLGSSNDLRGGEWLNVDIATPDVSGAPDAATQFQWADLNQPWPWPESSVDEIYAADIFEHLQNRIFTMNQAWKCLKSGGILTMECPDAAKGAGQWQDCTHVTPWTPNGLQYFQDGSGAHKRFAAAYGITARFELVSCTERNYWELAGSVRCEVWKFQAILQAVK